MYVRPRDSTIKLYDLDLLVYDGRIPSFSSENKQKQYFNRHAIKTISSCKYVRRSGRIRVDVGDTDPNSIGYMSFQNTGYGEQVFYAYLSEPFYINDQCYEYQFSIDLWQSWINKCKFRPDFVIDREHLSMHKKLLAETNPYDEELTEFTTPETDLPMGDNLYKWNYTVSDHVKNLVNDDGTFLFERTNDIVYVLYISPISFSDIALPDDYEGYDPLDTWNSIRDYLKATDCCFYHGYNYDSYLLGPEFGLGTNGYTYTNFNTNVSVLGFDCSNTTTLGKLQDLLDNITRWGCTSSIIGFYAVPKGIIKYNTFIQTRGGNMHVNCITQVTPPTFNIHSEKLYRAPYNYIELTTLTACKELYYEKFSELAKGHIQSPTINCMLDITGIPSLKASPVSYVCDFEYTENMDITNQIEMNNIPQAPYVTDAYLAMFSSLSQNLLSQNTLYNHNQLTMSDANATDATLQAGISALSSMATGASAGINSWTEGFTAMNSETLPLPKLATARDYNNTLDYNAGLQTSPVTSAGGLVGAASGVISSAANFGSTARNSDNTKTQNRMLDEMRTGAASFLSGRTPAVYNNFRGTVPPAIVQGYHGTLNPYTMYGRLGFFNICAVRRYLRHDVQVYFDNYFMEFGYKSMRVGLPYFVGFISGSQDTTKIPEWVDFHGQKITYFKGDGHISGVPVAVASALEALLSHGVTLINGDDLQ